MNLYQEIKSKPFFLIGPCVIENAELLDEVAKVLVKIKDKYQVPIVFKASYDKANRTSLSAFRGPGLEKGMKMLGDIKSKYNLPIVTDIHESNQAEAVAEVADILQIPAFLCRQTDLLVAAAKTGRIVNIKKAQFLSGKEMFYPAQKVLDSGNDQIILTERGNILGYGNLVVDFRNLTDMQELGYPVCMDCTHSVQRPGSIGGKTGGDRRFVGKMALAAKAFDANGYFIETHPDPEKGMSDAANMYYLNELEALIEKLVQA